MKFDSLTVCVSVGKDDLGIRWRIGFCRLHILVRLFTVLKPLKISYFESLVPQIKKF